MLIQFERLNSLPSQCSNCILIFYFRGEHMAVRNAEGSFFLCQASQNIYRHSKKIKIQWLGLTTENNDKKDLYAPEYYDTTGNWKKNILDYGSGTRHWRNAITFFQGGTGTERSKVKGVEKEQFVPFPFLSCKFPKKFIIECFENNLEMVLRLFIRLLDEESPYLLCFHWNLAIFHRKWLYFALSRCSTSLKRNVEGTEKER